MLHGTFLCEINFTKISFSRKKIATLILKSNFIHIIYFLNDLVWKWLDHENGTAGGEGSPTLYRELLQNTEEEICSLRGFSSVSGVSAGIFSKFVKPSSKDPQCCTVGQKI